MNYAEVLLPLPLPGYYTYLVPEELLATLAVGMRVVVQFGRKKLYTALVRNLHDKPPSMSAKAVISQVDYRPIVNAHQFAFWEWMAAYYMCYPGEVMNAALPSALKLSSETTITLIPEHGYDISKLTEKEYRILNALEQHTELNIGEAARIAGQHKVIPIINTLIEKGIVEVFEEVAERFKPKTEKYYQLAEVYQQNEKALGAMFDYLEKRAPRQNEVLQALLYHLPPGLHATESISRSVLLDEIKNADAALQALIEKGMVIEFNRTVSRLQNYEASQQVSSMCLTAHQQHAFDQTHTHFANNLPVLLHGITSSGKTEVYIKLIEETLRKGKQVLYMLPEIALTAQIITRLRMYFGDVVGIYHSRYSDSERA
ncbi:MAG: DEAD/DEAH box helicase family protein, partial [Bacteroidales bacterium]|nr:DEAD/DEAH box helicase family protein [Bacteroidales bacterium]